MLFRIVGTRVALYGVAGPKIRAARQLEHSIVKAGKIADATRAERG